MSVDHQERKKETEEKKKIASNRISLAFSLMIEAASNTFSMTAVSCPQL